MIRAKIFACLVLFILIVPVQAQDDGVPEQRQTITVENAGSVVELASLEANDGDLASVAFNADSTLLASAGDSHKIHIWDVMTGELITSLEGTLSTPFSLAFTADDKLLSIADLTISTFTASEPANTPYLWDIESGEYQTFVASPPSGGRMALSSDGQQLAVDDCAGTMNIDARGFSCSNYDILILDAATGETLQTIQGAFSAPTRALAFSPDGSLLASASADGSAKLWDVATGGSVYTLQDSDSQITSVTFSSDGALLATTSGDGKVWLFDAETGEQIASIDAHTEPALGVVFNSDNTVLATSGGDDVVYLWDVNTQDKLASLEGHTDSVWELAFSLDGTLLASAGVDGSVILWGIAG